MVLLTKNSGLPANPLCIDDDTCFTLVGDTLTLTVNGDVVQTWEKTAAPTVIGEPVGLLLALTHATT